MFKVIWICHSDILHIILLCSYQEIYNAGIECLNKDKNIDDDSDSDSAKSM